MQVMATLVLMLMMGASSALGESSVKVPNADLLGPYPILQFFAALIVLVCVAVGGFLWVRSRAAAEKPNDAAARYYFDGPLKAIFDYLAEIVSWRLGNIRDFIAECLSSQRQQLTQEIDSAKAEIKDEINRKHDENKDTMKDILALVTRIDERDKNRRAG